MSGYFHLLLTPPAGPLLLMLLGSIVWRRRARWRQAWVIGWSVVLYAFSTNWIGAGLLQMLEPPRPLNVATAASAQAIVVLGGGTYFNAPEYGGDTVSAPALERLRYAAWLHRRTGLPLLVSGGAPLGNADPEGRQMQRVLQNEFGVPVRWVEERAANTMENAAFAARMLGADQVQRVLVVTHAWHMPRAQWCFRQTRLAMIAAPTGFTTRYRFSLLDLLPSTAGLERSRLASHEWIGALWYRVRYAARPLTAQHT